MPINSFSSPLNDLMKTLEARFANLFSLRPLGMITPYVMKVRSETLQKEGERIVGKRERREEIGRDGSEHATFAPLILRRYVPPRFQFRAKVEMISPRLGEKGVYDAWRLKEET